MTPEIRSILARAYGYARGADKRLGDPTRAERAAAAAAGYPIDKLVRYTHDQAIARLHAVRSRLSVEEITGAFIAGVGGSAPRGLQPLISYAFARHLPVHAPTGARDHCEVCAIERRAEVDRSDELVRWDLGFLWNELPTAWVLDLEDLAARSPPRPTDADRVAFAALLAAIAVAPAGCTPSQLEQALLRAKVLPHTRDKYQRYGILEALAEVGVLPNPYVAPRWDRFTDLATLHAASAKLGGNTRSDIVLPFGGWRGALGVDWTRAQALFGVSPPISPSTRRIRGTPAASAGAAPASRSRAKGRIAAKRRAAT